MQYYATYRLIFSRLVKIQNHYANIRFKTSMVAYLNADHIHAFPKRPSVLSLFNEPKDMQG